MILVTGGSRSGKSVFAEELVKAMGQHYLYMATAKITDDEMARRVKKHQDRRSDAWETHEGYRELDQYCRSISGKYDGILLDSVSTMITNLLFDFIGDVDWDHFDFADVDYDKLEKELLAYFEAIAIAAQEEKLPLVIVTDEIGLGVIPETYLGRAFRDMIGIVNQKLASLADEVYLVVSGISMKIKPQKED